MAFSGEAERQRRPPRPAWMRPRTTESPAVLALVIMVLLGAALTTMVLVAQALTPPSRPVVSACSTSWAIGGVMSGATVWLNAGSIAAVVSTVSVTGSMTWTGLGGVF